MVPVALLAATPLSYWFGIVSTVPAISVYAYGMLAYHARLDQGSHGFAPPLFRYTLTIPYTTYLKQPQVEPKQS